MRLRNVAMASTQAPYGRPRKQAGQTKTALAVFKDNTKFTEFAYQLSDSIKHLKWGGRWE